MHSAMHNIAILLILSLRFQKSSPLFYQTNCFRMVGNKAILLSPMTMGPLSHLICFEESSFLRNSSVWNTTLLYSIQNTKDKTTFNPMGVGFGRSIAQKEDNSVSRVYTQ